MKKFISFAIKIFLSAGASAQLISRFNWENNPVSTAAYGPNAISVSSFATVSTGGINESKGLPPGNGMQLPDYFCYGPVITAANVQPGNGIQQIKIDFSNVSLRGVLIIRLSNTQSNTGETFAVVKR